MHRSVPNNPTRRARAGFTLTELLVAIGAVAILTVGVGRIFASINGLVSTGIAIAEVDQVARTIEQRMRDDFESLSAMNRDETFLVIRMRELGHPDRPIYLSAEDREFDIRAGISPYDEGSRAVYRRLDEMAFLAGDGSPGQFTSAQADGFFTGGQVQSGYARLYWGHGLKPKLDPEYPAPDPADRFPQDEDAPRTRPRLFEPDGYFGDPAGAPDSPLATSGFAITGRNQYASEWTLTRQPLLLAGPAVSGDIGDLSRPTPAMAGYTAALGSTGARREYAPFIRDIETFDRMWPDLGLSGDLNLPGNTEDYPDPRLIRHGRVDISAMSRDGVQRFLEGEPDNADGGAAIGEAALAGNPFRGVGEGSGRLGRRSTDNAPASASETFDINTIQTPLWRWPREGQGSSRNRYADTLRNVRSGIAGTLIRPLLEVEPPELDHVFDFGARDEETSENALMDSHAVIAPRCSSFAIAWSDGSRAKQEIDLNNDGKPEFFTGDLVWFDLTRVDPADPNEWDPEGIQRYTLEQILAVTGGRPEISFIEWPEGMWTPNPSPFADKSVQDENGRPTNPEINWRRQEAGSLNRLFGANASLPGQAVYNGDMTGGAPSWIDTPDTFEHLVIFPFRDSVRDNSDEGGVGFIEGRTDEWPKPSFIRVRLTLHDSQNRIDGGKQYEFIFPINLD
jgi:prepilin-type N-terminal cleavage/methylation domain-containing protein